MNFFEAQERARRSSRFLVLWFGMAVMGVILVIYLVAVTLNHFNKSNSKGIYLATDVSQLRWWDQDIFIAVTILVGGLISIGSWVKLSKLSAGGGVVASNLGGREIEPGTRDLRERRLLNVVEEMAIASGVPMPGVWVMDDEKGINAFAAGTDPANAVIGVTRGTLERLTRSELQGVIAHEFSHILNGDMKLNIRLMGWIFGLVMLATLGNMMMESLRFIRVSRDSEGGFRRSRISIVYWWYGRVDYWFHRRAFFADVTSLDFSPAGVSR